MRDRAVRGDGKVQESRGRNLPRRVADAVFLASAASFRGSYARCFQHAVGTRNFQAFIDGAAVRPSIFRQLVPATGNLTDGIFSDRLKQKLTPLRSDDGRGLYASQFSPIARNPAYSFRYLGFFLTAFVGAPVATALFYLVCRTEAHSPEVAIIRAALILLILYIQIRGGGHYAVSLAAQFGRSPRSEPVLYHCAVVHSGHSLTLTTLFRFGSDSLPTPKLRSADLEPVQTKL